MADAKGPIFFKAGWFEVNWRLQMKGDIITRGSISALDIQLSAKENQGHELEDT
jgi:hypothetical protein